MNKNVIDLLESFPFKLPKSELEQIFVDASFQPQDNDVRKTNRTLQFFGYDIIAASYACYLLNQDEQYSTGEIARQMQGATSKIVNIIYTRYNLESYLLVSNGEIGNKHPDIAQRLICLTYIHYGAKKTYDFLTPIFQTIRQEPDYKTILQNFAQAQKMSPQYTLVEKGGAQHAPYFVVEVRVGNEIEIGEDSSQKKASKEAARNYLLRHNIPLDNSKVKKNKKENTIRGISNERLDVINKVVKILDIKKDWVANELLNIALTHKSYINESGSDYSKCYDRLREIGAYILQLHCDDYVFHKFDITQFNFKTKCSEFLSQSMLNNILPDKCYDYVLKGKGVKKMADDKIKYKIISDVQKSLLGAMWISYINFGNEELKDKSVYYTRKLFEKNLTNIHTIDYRTALDRICAMFKLKMNIEQSIIDGHLDNNPTYKSVIVINDVNGLKIEASGIGGSKKKSVHDSARNALREMYDRCNDGEMKKELSKILRR